MNKFTKYCVALVFLISILSLPTKSVANSCLKFFYEAGKNKPWLDLPSKEWDGQLNNYIINEDFSIMWTVSRFLEFEKHEPHRGGLSVDFAQTSATSTKTVIFF